VNKLVLGKHSGRHALAARLKDLGFDSPAPSSTGPSRSSRSWRTGRRRSTTRTHAIVADEATQIPDVLVDYLHHLGTA